jgi:hypothetical protein
MQSLETVATTSPVDNPRADGGAGSGGVVRDDLREAERGEQPVPDREPVPHHARNGLRCTEAEQDQGPLSERGVVAFDDPFLDRAADRERHQGLRQHPRDAEADAGEQRRNLVPTDPDEQPNGRPRVRRAGVAKRKLDQGSVRSIAVCGRCPRLDPSHGSKRVAAAAKRLSQKADGYALESRGWTTWSWGRVRSAERSERV